MKSRVLTITTVLLLATSAAARAEDCECKTYCPRCNVICVPSREIVNEKKSCFEVDCEWICVPKIRFPWESCCKPKCAWVRKVKVLKEIEYECPKCEYKWTAMCNRPPCPTCPSGRCTHSQGPAPHSHGAPPPTVDPDAPPLPPVHVEGEQASFDEPSRPLLAPFIRFFRRDESR